MRLVIVESPKKARTISGILGSGYKVEASFGHVRDLPARTLGIDIENGFQPEWVPVAKAKTRLADLRRIASAAESVILATDPDREGEAIAWHIADALRLRAPVRVVFHAITASAVRAAFEQPRALDAGLIDAQQARRLLDRLVGYKVSPLLWQKIARGTSAGRVQSVALRLVVDREREILAFVPREYWTIDAVVYPEGRPTDRFTARLVEVDGKPADISTTERASEIETDLRTSKLSIIERKSTTTMRSPPPPFITSSLQQVAAGRLHINGKRVMQLAQSLYESGLITYHRTDAVRVEPEAVARARAVITERFGNEYLPEKPRSFANRVKNAQEAHEAIRPVDPTRQPETLIGSTPSDERALYRVIWQRFIASQMAAARYARVTIDVAATAEHTYRLRAGSTALVFSGYLAVYGGEERSSGVDATVPATRTRRGRSNSTSPLMSGSEKGLDGSPDVDEDGGSTENEAENARLPEVAPGASVHLDDILTTQHFTKPPTRYSEPALVKTLEKAGVGRPSTFATIVATIVDRGYVTKDGTAFCPTELGYAVNDFVVSYFPRVADIGFTADLEDELDAVARGERPWRELLSGFYRPFSDALEIAARANRSSGPTLPKAASNPDKRTTRTKARKPRLAIGRPPDPLTRQTIPRGAKRPSPPDADGQASPTPIGELCPACGKTMVERVGPYGRFLGCTGYPKCKSTIKLEPLSPESKKPTRRSPAGRLVTRKSSATPKRARPVTRSSPKALAKEAISKPKAMAGDDSLLPF